MTDTALNRAPHTSVRSVRSLSDGKSSHGRVVFCGCRINSRVCRVCSRAPPPPPPNDRLYSRISHYRARAREKNSDLLERTREMIALTLKAPRQCTAITEPRYCDTFIVQLQQRDNKLTAALFIALPSRLFYLFAMFFSLP